MDYELWIFPQPLVSFPVYFQFKLTFHNSLRIMSIHSAVFVIKCYIWIVNQCTVEDNHEKIKDSILLKERIFGFSHYLLEFLNFWFSFCQPISLHSFHSIYEKEKLSYVAMHILTHLLIIPSSYNFLSHIETNALKVKSLLLTFQNRK